MKITKKRLYGKLDVSNKGIALIKEDEIFVKVVGWKNYWISNYSRLLEFDEKANCYKIVKLYQDKSESNHQYYYRQLNPNNKVNKKEPTKQFLHRLTAKAFCQNDNPSIKTEVHHIKPFNPNKKCEINNRADNLLWVEPKVHRMLDDIDYIVITDSNNKTKKYSNPLEAFKSIGMNEDIFYQDVVCKYEPLITNHEMKYTKYNICISGEKKKIYLITIYSKEMKGNKTNYVIGDFAKSAKDEIRKYGEVRKHN
ncbi:HNH endonuclease signature motif containing protein [Clostridium sp. Marseille-P299]|uniref:HNH endonuclease signature motif containing protein n=1 Tax=Clostridium sp. Marseille-P299 TaxID=1805477 RepID=UPI00082EB56F|nr:HNH endonuclease signature motif containing protein [Clostridium sp. Marseille-P299]